MTETITEKVYEKTLKPLIQDRKYGLASELLRNNSALKGYMSKEDMHQMMDHYEKTLYVLSDGLELLTKRMEALRK
jgi:hypothetical protein